MKRSYWLFLLGLFLARPAHALVADKFDCVLELSDAASGATAKTDKQFFVARLPLSSSPAPDVRLTAGQTTERLLLDLPTASFGANLNFYYKHALRIDANGKPLEARQLTCVGLTGDFCAKGKTGLQICSEASVACIEPPNPFDVKNGWSMTTLFDGVPAFNEQKLGAKATLITDGAGKMVGTVTLNCQFLGTYL
jgi:hypothetical protein